MITACQNIKDIQRFNPDRVGEINQLGDLEALNRKQEACKSRYVDHLNGIKFSKIKMKETEEEVTTFLQ